MRLEVQFSDLQRVVDSDVFVTRKEFIEANAQLGNTVVLELDSDYKLSLSLCHGEEVLSTTAIDFPLEEMVVSGSYNEETHTLELTLKNGNVISIPFSDMINGLVQNTRKINGYTLDKDINLVASDVNAAELNKNGMITVDSTIRPYAPYLTAPMYVSADQVTVASSPSAVDVTDIARGTVGYKGNHTTTFLSKDNNLQYAEMRIFDPTVVNSGVSFSGECGGAWINIIRESYNGSGSINFGAVRRANGSWTVRFANGPWTGADVTMGIILNNTGSPYYSKFMDANQGVLIRVAIIDGAAYCFIEDQLVMTYNLTKSLYIDKIGSNVGAVGNGTTWCNKVTELKVSTTVPQEIVKLANTKKTYATQGDVEAALQDSKDYADGLVGDISVVLEDVLTKLSGV